MPSRKSPSELVEAFHQASRDRDQPGISPAVRSYYAARARRLAATLEVARHLAPDADLRQGAIPLQPPPRKRARKRSGGH